MIPKIIHYCWLSNDPVPVELQKCMETWQKILWDYEFIKWDFNRFDINSSDWVKEAFANKKYAFACDYIRLYAIYHYGGVYMDMDIEVLKSFNDLLEKKYMLAKERPDKLWLEAGCFGAVKHSEFIFKCLEYYKDKHFINANGIIEDTPLPKIMACVYKDHDYDFELGDWLYFTCKSYDTGIVTKSDSSYAIHHFAGSWKEKDELETHKKAQRLRNKVLLIGPLLGFIYEKTVKLFKIIKYGKNRELITRIRRFLKS